MKKRISVFVLAVFGMLHALSVAVAGEHIEYGTKGNYGYTVSEEGMVTITSYNDVDAKRAWNRRAEDGELSEEDIDRGEKVSIPMRMDTKTVVKIDDGAFSNKHYVVKIELPVTIERIGEDAFQGCEFLREVELNKGLKAISVDAFARCKRLEEMEIPEGVTSIGAHAFVECESLRRIRIPSTVTFIGHDAFYLCSEDLVVECVEGSVAEQYAKKYEHRYVYYNLDAVTEATDENVERAETEGIPGWSIVVLICAVAAVAGGVALRVVRGKKKTL